jgi:hypothetical protein
MHLGIYGLVATVVVGVLAYDRYDKKANYQPVNGRISAVNEQCYLEKSERGVVTKTTMTSDLLPCEVATVLTREHPKWYGYDVKHKIEIQFVYVSPVDRATHASKLQLSAFPNGMPRARDVIPVLASKTKADKTRQARLQDSGDGV